MYFKITTKYVRWKTQHNNLILARNKQREKPSCDNSKGHEI